MLNDRLNRRKRKNKEIDPDEIFMDSHNLPRFDNSQFEGRLDKPISKISLMAILGVFILLVGVYIARAWTLQIKNGESYALRSENNRLRHTPVFATRGVIYDRNGAELAWNAPGEDVSVPIRKYASDAGASHVLGYVQYPSKDSAGFYYQEDFVGIDGAEKYFDRYLQGVNGLKLMEVDARGNVQSENVVKPPDQGENITISIDSRIQSKMYSSIKDIATRVGFAGGAGVMMDVTNGEIIAMTSYPEYDSEVMSSKTDVAKVKEYLSSKDKPFLDRAVDGLYAPGSIIKPYMALGALTEDTIDPRKKILSTGSISIPNEYDPAISTVFKDWKALGWMDMRSAIAMSSDVYFYALGGGYKDQKGLGIVNINKYTNMFGFGRKIENSFFTGAGGVVPSPEWKIKTFNGETWRLGNTYHTTIGQYGFQVSPVQSVRAMAAVATKGILRDPSIIKDEPGPVIGVLPISESSFNIIHEGMRMGATEGTGKALNFPFVEVATKTGTAELGVDKSNVNSWVTGFFPYENPRYAFAVVLEKGSAHNLIGAVAVMKEVFEWMNANTPEYFR
ncbi:MAG: penicillin-binding transpeptidase domain-containing protein [bacterium]|nr:penicillin-binding transpeptidase domain-containing protein [bacterium]